jgi:hypothetical protein
MAVGQPFVMAMLLRLMDVRRRQHRQGADAHGQASGKEAEREHW